jgi:hypothetical protein
MPSNIAKFFITAFGVAISALLHADELPAIRAEDGQAQLIVHGKPFLMLGGELGNSSAGTAAQADSILPEEGHFDFSLLDHWMAVARQQHLHLVLLWFGSWKNAFSNYAPVWVRSDQGRQLLMSAHELHVYRVKLYCYGRSAGQ